MAYNVIRDLDLADINQPEKLPERYRKLMIKRDFRWFDRYVLKHDGDKELKIYQLKAASPMIYIQRKKLQREISRWMKSEGFTPDEIKRWSEPRYEWPEIRITPEQERILWEWRDKYDIKDRTDWTKGITLSDADKKKLDEYKQIAILQPRQSGKSEIVVRGNIYCITTIRGFDAAVFAPTEKQAKNFIFQRTRDYIEDNPAYRGRFSRLNALDLSLDKNKASGSSFMAGSASPTANIEGDSLDWAIIDESQDVSEMKVKKSIKYMMAAKGGAMIKIGTVNTIKSHFWESTTKKGSPFWYQVIIYPDIVAACRPDWADFISKEIEESGRWSDTVRMSVFLEWLLTQGMFITDEQWDALCDIDLDWVEYDKNGLQYAVIDVAKSKDETVVMVGKAAGKPINGRQPFKLLNIMTLPGVDYDSQYEQIKAWLDHNYNVAAIGIDDTGGRGGLADRFEKTSYRVEKFTYSRPSKSEWYTNLSTIINFQHEAIKKGLYHDRIILIPASEKAKKEKIFRDFEDQMGDLLREYIGKFLVVHHPEREDAHDDYPDDLMMMSWMFSRIHISVEELIEAVESASNTEMDRMDWTEDVFDKGGNDKTKRRRKLRKMIEEDDELAQIERDIGTDLDSPDWD